MTRSSQKLKENFVSLFFQPWFSPLSVGLADPNKPFFMRQFLFFLSTLFILRSLSQPVEFWLMPNILLLKVLKWVAIITWKCSRIGCHGYKQMLHFPNKTKKAEKKNWLQKSTSIKNSPEDGWRINQLKCEMLHCNEMLKKIVQLIKYTFYIQGVMDKFVAILYF